MSEAVKLDNALRILADAFTRDDRECGFSVESTPSPMISAVLYYEAWRAVREHLHLQIDPEI